jgi:hypothetical protein
MTTRAMGQPRLSKRAVLLFLSGLAAAAALLGAVVAARSGPETASPGSLPAAAAIPVLPAAPAVAGEPLTIYLVQSAAEAAQLHPLLAEGEAIGAALGTAPLPYAVLVVGASDDTIHGELGCAAYIGATLGASPLRVQDLRN